MGGQAEQIEIVPSGFLNSRRSAFRSGLELHGHQTSWGGDSAPSLGHHLSTFYGNEREVLGRVEGPTMGQYEDTVCLPLRQEFRRDVARRHVSNGDAVDLRSEEKPIDAIGADDRLNGGRLVTMLRSNGVEVVSEPMGPGSRARTARPPITANSPIGTASAKAARDATSGATPELARRSSPDTNSLLRVPAVEYLPTASAVLGKVEGDDQAVGYEEAVPARRRGQDEPIPGRTHRDL